MIFKRISIFCLESARERNYDAKTKVPLREHTRELARLLREE
jgi:hypothetical protein